jgi:hypothetical protein
MKNASHNSFPRDPRPGRRATVALGTALLALVAGLWGCATTGGGGDLETLRPHRVSGGVLFQYRSEDASSVSLVGDFNQWSPNEDSMTDENRDGIWTLTYPLTPGVYEYKFVVNGDLWIHDPSNPNRVADGFGGENSVVEVH